MSISMRQIYYYEKDFNFNASKCKLFETIINNPIGGKENLTSEQVIEAKDALIMLDIVTTFHDNPTNQSLMYTYGGLNNTKGNLVQICIQDGIIKKDYGGLDRLDLFVYYLNRYFKYGDLHILSYGRCISEDTALLVKHLAKYGNIYAYCKEYYYIEKDMVDELILSGENPICSSRDVINYCNLALDYWDKKREGLKLAKV